MVSFLPLDLTNPDSIEIVLSHIDYTMQYGEDEEPKEVSDSANSFIGYHFSLVWWPRPSAVYCHDAMLLRHYLSDHSSFVSFIARRFG